MEYSEQNLYISDLATAEGVNFVIEESAFKKCVVRGPAVVTLLRTQVNGGEVNLTARDPGLVVLAAEAERTTVPTGVVVVRDCTFEDCTFEGVTFFGPAEQMEQFTQVLTGNVRESVSE